MTRVVYTDLTLPYTPGSSTFPSSTHVANDITHMYKLAAEIMGIEYSATAPDSEFLFGLIKAKVEAHTIALQRANQPGEHVSVPALVFTEKEEQRLAGSDDADDWTVDSASKNEDIGD